MKKTPLFAILLAAPLLGMAQRTPLDAASLLQDVQVLSADSMQGRLSGSEGSAMAQAYLLQRFQQVGLLPFNGDYKQLFEIDTQRAQVPQAVNLIGYIPGKLDKAIVDRKSVV